MRIVRFCIFALFFFACGFALSFYGGRLFFSPTVVPSPQPSSRKEKTSPEVSKPLPHQKPTGATPAMVLPGGAQEEVDMTVDFSLPSLSAPLYRNHPKKRKVVCRKTYPQYGGQNRYQWAQSFTGLRTQTRGSLLFYAQDDDVWQHFSPQQQRRLMQDLFYCDPLSFSTTTITRLQILSSKDSSVLSEYHQ